MPNEQDASVKLRNKFYTHQFYVLEIQVSHTSVCSINYGAWLHCATEEELLGTSSENRFDAIVYILYFSLKTRRK